MGYFDMVKLLLLFKRYVHHCTRAPFFSFFLSSIPFPQVFLYWTNASKVHASQAKATPDTSVMCFGYIIISVISHQSALALVFQTPFLSHCWTKLSPRVLLKCDVNRHNTTAESSVSWVLKREQFWRPVCLLWSSLFPTSTLDRKCFSLTD